MIQVINRALNILEILAQEPDKEFGLSEIATAVELNAGTCANILKTLVYRNYVEQSGTKKRYKLGYMIILTIQNSSMQQKSQWIIYVTTSMKLSYYL